MPHLHYKQTSEFRHIYLRLWRDRLNCFENNLHVTPCSVPSCSALLPPRMKPAANSQSQPSNANSQSQFFGPPKNEPDSNDQNWGCGQAGRGVHLKLESGSAQISGKLCSFWDSFYWSQCCTAWSSLVGRTMLLCFYLEPQPHHFLQNHHS